MIIKLSLVIPCYNESKNLPLLLNRCKEIAEREDNIEFVIVDNGSTDETSLVLDELALDLDYITRVKVETNQGYGHGILAGLRQATGELLGWSHADMQTDLADALKGLDLFRNTIEPEQLFVKGKRHSRPIADTFFTMGMSIFETFLLRRLMWDINAQPTIFHRKFFLIWDSPPNDFSLDLYAYFLAKKTKLVIKRFPVLFGKRAYGVSNWNINFASKYRFIKRTLVYSFSLHRKMK